jgi:crotonobetainyl-CoA:carnitine CoA-transferase CaiB-like acyl-CoA transferase
MRGIPVRPLEDVRIIAIEQYGAGPWGSVHLADLGADVIKIEDPRTGGDVGRYVPPFQEGEDSLFYEAFNRNKRSIGLDITTESGRQVLNELVRGADAVYSNLRGDVPAKLGLRYADLAEVNPRIVCCSLSSYGMESTRAKEPGYDYIIQGLAGWMELTGEPDGPPAKSGLSLVDFSGGFVAAIALLAGVHAARRDGVGMDCDLSLYDTALSLLNYPAIWHLNEGFEPVRTRHSAHPSLVPFQNFRTADECWIVVGCAKEKFWQRLAVAIGREELLDDPRFASFADRRDHAGELLTTLEQHFLTRPSTAWLELLTAAGVPCGPVNDVAAALRDPQVAERGLLIETEHPVFGTVQQLGSPVRVGAEAPVHRRAPQRHEDGPAILAELGYDDQDVARLEAAGAFGGAPGEVEAAE